MNKLKIFTMLIISVLFSSVLHADVQLGMSTALSGPASALGDGVKSGVEAYIKMVNDQGGVNGEKISLTALDDAYEPDKAGPNMHQLVKDGVAAVIGNVGTPTAIVSVPIANQNKMLLFGAYTGAGVLRQTPPDRYIINYRASYAQETAAMINGLLKKGIKPEEIAFFTQNDGYGDAGFSGAVKALNAKGFTDVDKLAHGRYARNTKNVEEGLSTILDAAVEPKAIIMVGSYGPCAEFIKLAKDEFPEALFLNVSFVGSIPLMEQLGAKGEGVIVTQVVPHYASDLPGVQEYRQAFSKYFPDKKPGFVSLEGYLAAKILVEGMKNVSGPINTESLIDALEALNNYDLGIGEMVSYSKSNHQAMHKVWPTMIKNGEYVSFDWNDL